MSHFCFGVFVIVDDVFLLFFFLLFQTRRGFNSPVCPTIWLSDVVFTHMLLSQMFPAFFNSCFCFTARQTQPHLIQKHHAGGKNAYFIMFLSLLEVKGDLI